MLLICATNPPSKEDFTKIVATVTADLNDQDFQTTHFSRYYLASCHDYAPFEGIIGNAGVQMLLSKSAGSWQVLLSGGGISNRP